ncbi:MAG: type II secretion system minor pseudopilin GspI [Steroidobacteraceae bacterium]
MRADTGRGFTLIEVLAALVIVALGMLGVIEAVTQNARNGTYLRDRTIAHWVAMNLLTDQRLQPAPPAVAESSDDVEMAGQRWRWTLKVTQTQVQSLRRIDVEVRRADAPESSPLATVTGFYGSAIGPAGGESLMWSDVTGGADEDGGGGKQGGGGDGTRPPTPPPAEPPPTIPPIEDDQ